MLHTSPDSWIDKLINGRIDSKATASLNFPWHEIFCSLYHCLKKNRKSHPEQWFTSDHSDPSCACTRWVSTCDFIFLICTEVSTGSVSVQPMLS